MIGSIYKAMMVCGLLCSSALYSQYTSIPDPNFEQKLIGLGIDTGDLDGQVLTADITDVTTLLVSSSNISDLTGIEDFSSLSVLAFNLNSVTEIDLSQNTQLVGLYCAVNQLTTLDLSGNPNLTNLRCSINSLIEIDVSQCPVLETIDCYDNQLTQLDLLQNPNLIELECYENELMSIDLSGSIALEVLRCNNNNLASLDISQAEELNMLYCYENQLTELIVGPSSVRDIFTQNNHITSLDLSQADGLKLLDCSDNLLTGLDVSQNPLLEYLSCSYNPFLQYINVEENYLLEYFECNSTSIHCINIQNDNNYDLTFSAVSNPDLTCIQVNDVSWVETNWLDVDSSAFFSAECYLSCLNSVGVDDLPIRNYISVYPNPFSGAFNLSYELLQGSMSYRLSSVDGQLLAKDKLSASGMDSIDLELETGMYILQVLDSDGIEISTRVLSKY